MKRAPTQLGQDMWTILSKAFMQTAVDNSITTIPEKAQLWAGFMAAASGYMTGDIGGANTHAILITIAEACAVAGEEPPLEKPRPDLKVVKP